MGSYLPLNNFRNSIPRTLYGCHGQMRQKGQPYTFFFIWNPSPHSLARNDIRSCTRLLLKLEINFFLNCVLRVAQEHENNFFLIFRNKFHIHQSILSKSSKLTSKPKSYNTIQVYDLFKKILQNPSPKFVKFKITMRITYMLHQCFLHNTLKHYYGIKTN